MGRTAIGRKPFDLNGPVRQGDMLLIAGLRQELRARINLSGLSVCAWCKENDVVHAAEVYEFLRGLRRPSEVLLRTMGYSRIEIYAQVKREQG